MRRIAPDLPEGFLDQLRPARVCVAARTSYASQLEQCAEWMATFIQARADERRSDVYLGGKTRSAYAIADRFLNVLGLRS